MYMRKLKSLNYCFWKYSVRLVDNEFSFIEIALVVLRSHDYQGTIMSVWERYF